MKKLASVILCMAMALGMAACTSTPTETSASETTLETNETHEPTINDSAEGKLFAQFLKLIGENQDIEAVAASLGKEDICGYDCGTMTMNEGYLDGFSAEISGFNKCVKFSPYIGSIPFVGYVFETDDPETLKAKLLENADPMWNICTEANDPFCDVSGNYVFFVMTPKAE